jgi:mRNA-degrading endonuclease RelE of RelBE toxin-antitoxin system
MQVLLHPIPSKYLDRLDRPTKDRIKAAFEGLAKEPPEGDIKPYVGNPGIWRLKISGGYRALFKFVNNTILVTHIEPRGQAYTKKTRKKRG